MNSETKTLIGIDDTDNKESRGTGFHARMLGSEINKKNIGEIVSISRHQLFFDSRIPYTSQNSSACLLLKTKKVKEEIFNFCKQFLLTIAVDGSDIGLAVANANSINQEVIDWGKRAKSEVLFQEEAKLISMNNKILLEGLTGTKDGIIGALAAVGLRKYGNDGRCISLKGIELRDINGQYSVEKLKSTINIDDVCDLNHQVLNEKDIIDTGDWLRPVLQNNKIIVLTEKNTENEWIVARKEIIKSLSD